MIPAFERGSTNEDLDHRIRALAGLTFAGRLRAAHLHQHGKPLARTAATPPAQWSFTVVDARTRVEYEENHIAGRINCPASQTQTSSPSGEGQVAGADLLLNGPKCTKSQKGARLALWARHRKVPEYNEGPAAGARPSLPVAGSPLASRQMARSPPTSCAPHGIGRTGRGGRADAVEFASVRVAGTINIPLDELEKRAREMRPRVVDPWTTAVAKP